MSSGTRFVVDANILLAALFNPKGPTMARLAMRDWAWCAPAWVWIELERHLPSFAVRLKTTPEDLRAQLARLHRLVDTVDANQLTEQEVPEIPDRKDALYVACMRQARAAGIWSRDRAFHDFLPEWVTPEPLLGPLGPT